MILLGGKCHHSNKLNVNPTAFGGGGISKSQGLQSEVVTWPLESRDLFGRICLLLSRTGHMELWDGLGLQGQMQWYPGAGSGEQTVHISSQLHGQ